MQIKITHRAIGTPEDNEQRLRFVYNLIFRKALEHIQAHSVEIQISKELEARADRHFDIVIHHFASHKLPTSHLHPLVEYAGFVLNKGTYEEQGELVKGIQSTFVIRDREILVQQTEELCDQAVKN